MKSHNIILKIWKQHCWYIVLFGECGFLSAYRISNAFPGLRLEAVPMLMIFTSEPTVRAGGGLRKGRKVLDCHSEILLTGFIMDDMSLKLPQYFLPFPPLCSHIVSQAKVINVLEFFPSHYTDTLNAKC